MLAMSRAVEVRRLSGDVWCRIIATENLRGQDLKLVFARKLKICECRLDLVAGYYRVRIGTPMVKIRKWIQPLNILYAMPRNAHASGSNAADLIANGFCFRCMKEAGVQAYEILVYRQMLMLEHSGL